jgi:cytochrome c55X
LTEVNAADGRWSEAAHMKHVAAFALAMVALAAHGGERERELIRLVRQDCGSCHGMTLSGGLGLPLTADALRDKPVDSLVATVMHGRPGTPMPAWKTILTEKDAEWIVARLLEGFPQETQ